MWQIRVDTGGTFTDAVGISPGGAERRVKILSTSALRGRVVRRLDERRLIVDGTWGAPEGLVEGFVFRLLGRSHPEVRVARLDRESRTLELSAGVEDGLVADAAFELVSDEASPILAARLLTGTPASVALPPSRVRLATTLGTNTLLQRAGVGTALFITRGFGDLLSIGNQQRPDLFALDVRKPHPLYDSVVEVDERLDARGEVLLPIDLDAAAAGAARLISRGVRTAAIALLNAYRNPRHEQELARRLAESGFEQVCCSTDVAPRIKLLPRAETTVVDAYLSPVMRTYLDDVRGKLESGGLLVMTSAGGLLSPEAFRPKDSLLSGPAGGAVGAARAARRSGIDRAIGFDMGGTSTDVTRWDGDYEYVYEHTVGDAHLVAPALAIESVAAGGGSICWLDCGRIRVGPRSAGARPGPACYGAGGPLTLTDVNLLSGRIDAERFEIPIQVEPALLEFRELSRQLEQQTGETPERAALLEGLLSVADETMADAIRGISLRRGYDPAEYTLVAFGGAGGQHACAVARRLGMRRVLVPADAALLSAHGLGYAVLERFVERQVLETLDDVVERVPEWLDELAGQAVEAVREAGGPVGQVVIRRRILHLRFAGQDATVDVEWTDRASIQEAFEERYSRLFGHRPDRRPIELESLSVVASCAPSESEEAGPANESTASATGAEAVSRHRVLFSCGWLDVPGFDRDRLQPGDRAEGPALVLESRSATVVEPGWTLQVDSTRALLLEQAGATEARSEADRPEAIRIELFSQRFQSLVREMGQRLEQTSVSTNVKERLDFSCALLDPAGELVVNAPHIPVHLGALGLCVRSLIGEIPMRHGDVIVTNHPAFGGSHLPDVTVVTPVFGGEDHGRLIGYVANRAHHAEIGGTRPGSMPPTARRLAEEGVVIPPTYLVELGEPRWETLRGFLEAGEHPSRAVEDNLADLRAALAANNHGAAALRALADEHGAETLSHYMMALQALAERRIGEALAAMPDGAYEATERLDDGSPLQVLFRIEGDRARVDFSGSAAVHAGNLNATPAIVQSVVIYVLRLLVRHPLPLNEGLMRPVTIALPHGMLNPVFGADPRRAPAVGGGNVETSQRLVDTLLRALGLAACSQGTMNNVVFGNAGYGYYETIGGGCGAGPGFDGASGVHSHMTNTRITDPEILEHRYPVRLLRFALRPCSGGLGKHPGGDGLVRELVFLEPASVSVLTQHRVEAPYGLGGGAPGARGRQIIVRAGGEVLELGSIDGAEVEAGDRLVIETPGGGGYGS